MNIDTTIYGYIGDGFICCNKCAEEIALDVARYQRDDEPEIAELQDYEQAGLSPLYSHHDQTACGETCDCGAEVFEEAEDHGIDEACRDCGYEVPALWALVNARRIVLSRHQTELAAEDALYEWAEEAGVDPGLAGLKVIETNDELYPGVGGVIPAPGELALPGLAPV